MLIISFNQLKIILCACLRRVCKKWPCACAYYATAPRPPSFPELAHAPRAALMASWKKETDKSDEATTTDHRESKINHNNTAENLATASATLLQICIRSCYQQRC